MQTHGPLAGSAWRTAIAWKELTTMPTTPNHESATARIQEGWNHLKSQRPLAAWGSWQRVLRENPASAAARQAISTLESSSDLPLAARTKYLFREPIDPARRALWDDQMRGRTDQDLGTTAELFGRLAAADPADSAAWYNRALCLAWSGNNRESINCLDRAVGIDAGQAFDRAVNAWVLGEVLRQGAGAEMLADDLRFACTITWRPSDTAWLLGEFHEIHRVRTPTEPGATNEDQAEIEVFEWLDRPASYLNGVRLAAGSLPTVLATVYISGHSLRLSSPRAENLERIEETLFPRLEDGAGPVRREASPLPLAFLDAALWTVRIPADADPARADQLRRESVEDYFENQWIHRVRHGLNDRSPLAAATAARDGDVIARAKLSAVVQLREQFGCRPSAILLYQGYPFDRLRRRLGLELVDSNSVDAHDLACASADELDDLDVGKLDDAALVEAFTSAAGLRNDARTARFATELFRRQPGALTSLELTSVVSPLVRQVMRRNEFDNALSWLKTARTLSDGNAAKTLEIWRAEVLARAGRPDSALTVYERLITPDGAGAELALDAALTMLDNGQFEQAKVLSKRAGELASLSSRSWIGRRADQLLERLL
jgi:tetratricopeptide (TPR) repeat protein